MLIRVIKDWGWPDLMRQTPGGSGQWKDVQFTLDPVEQCDFVVVLNRVVEDSTISCSPEQVWSISQEPPVPEYEWLSQGYSQFHRVFTPETSFEGAKFVHSHGALPWHIGRSFDELVAVSVPDKNRRLSWVTSNKSGRSGHKARLAFLKKIESEIVFDLWGRGYHPLVDKWDGLAPYRYSLAIENHSAPYYWTEKLADCFLSWTMPIYYGCTNITDFFPSESLIVIDIHDPDVSRQIEDVIHSDRWIKHRDAIEYAREQVLNKHQFFPFILDKIEPHRPDANTVRARQIELKKLANKYPASSVSKIRNWVAYHTGLFKRE